jgi:hypothetical protein
VTGTEPCRGPGLVLDRAKVAAHVIEHRGYVGFGQFLNQPEQLLALGLGEEWAPRELRHSFVSILSAHGVRIEDISDLVGHSGTTVTETVYRHEIRPALTTGATAMDKILAKEGTPPRLPAGEPVTPRLPATSAPVAHPATRRATPAKPRPRSAPSRHARHKHVATMVRSMGWRAHRRPAA